LETAAESTSIGVSAESRVLVHDSSKCTACTTCMIACSMKHFGVADYEKSFIKIIFNPIVKAFEAAYCHHCDEPYCLNICPVNAIYKDNLPDGTVIVRISTLKCIGCGSCRLACPMSIPHEDPVMRVAVKCDLCDGDPECVKACPTQALRFIPRSEALNFLKKVYG